MYPVIPTGKPIVVGPRTTPAQPTPKGALVRRLVRTILLQRRLVTANGRSRLGGETMRMAMMRLDTWLQYSYDHMRPELLHAFWQKHEYDVRLVAPGRGGLTSITRIQDLCA